MGLERVVLGLLGWSAASIVAAVVWARAAAHARAGLPPAPVLDDGLVFDDVTAAPVTGEANAAGLVSDALGASAWADLGALQDRIAGRRAARRVAEADGAVTASTDTAPTPK